jgi:hypothetical protein
VRVKMTIGSSCCINQSSLEKFSARVARLHPGSEFRGTEIRGLWGKNNDPENR